MLYIESKQRSYKLQRSASQAASISLVAGSDEYYTMFDCAKKIKDVLGEQGYKDYGDGIYESLPFYRIPFKDVHAALKKLSQHHSIALLDYFSDKTESKFILIWKISVAPVMPVLCMDHKASVNLEDY